MKKILIIILLLTMLTGCTATQEPVQTEAIIPTEVVAEEQVSETAPPAVSETEPEPEATQLPMVAVYMPMRVDSLTDDSGKLIYRSKTQSMQLTLRDPDVADKIIIDYLNRVDSHREGIESVKQASQNTGTDDPYALAYFYDVIYSPTRIDHNVLSLYGESASYSGGNHPQRVCTPANYNMVTGDVLTLGSILYHIDAKSTLIDLVIKSLDEIAEEKYLWDGYDAAVRNRFGRDESFDEDWFFTDEGLCFFFSPYEIAPYTSGVIIAQIPYSELTGVIDDDFFPPEEDICSGDVIAVPMSSDNMDQFTQIAEVTVDKDGEMFFLYTTGTVRNLEIQTITAYDDVTQDTAEQTIFATYTLSPGDAIMLKVNPVFDDSFSIKLSYESNGELYTTTLTPQFLGK